MLQKPITVDRTKPPLLDIYCSRRRELGLPQMRNEISKTADSMKRMSDARGVDTPSVVLFNEASLKTHFDVPKKEMMSAVEQMQKLLPQDQWAVVAFSVMQNCNGRLLNMGYLFSREGKIKRQPKRIWARGNAKSLIGHCGEIVWGDHARKWECLENRLSEADVPFLMAKTPCGQRLEFRICIDVIANPIFYDDKMITLVMAEGLDPADADDLSIFRRGLIINDSEREDVGVLPRAFGRQTHILGSYGWKRVSLYPNELL